MTITDVVKDTQLKTMNMVHRTLLCVSGGRIGARLGDMQVFKVTTTGRTSGKPRSVMLTSPLQVGDGYVFVASKGGDDRDPDWYRNMVANPEITIEPANGGAPLAMVARTATPDEKADLWPQIVAAYKGYAGYQTKTDRDIPVVVLEPR